MVLAMIFGAADVEWKEEWLIYLMRQDKDNVYPEFASDSLASSNLYSCTNISIHTQTTCEQRVSVTLTSWLYQLLFIPHACFIYSDEAPLSQDTLRYPCPAMPCCYHLSVYS